MANIITSRKSRSWQRRKDVLHKRRKELAESMKDGLMSTSQMKKGETEFMNHDEQVCKYDQWKAKNQDNMTEWGNINREFKKHNEEGVPMSMDTVRESKTKGKDIKYD